MGTFPQLQEKFVCSCWFSNLGILPIIPKEPFTITPSSYQRERERERERGINQYGSQLRSVGDTTVELILPLRHLLLIIDDVRKIQTFVTNIKTTNYYGSFKLKY